MNEMRAIAERIVVTRTRRDELSELRPVDDALRVELTALERDVSRFDDMCMRVRRTNLCRDGFTYGEILRHPADSNVAVVVRIGDGVEFVKGQGTPDGVVSIMEATRIVVGRIRRGASVRDWYGDRDGRSLAQLEDATYHEAKGMPKTKEQAEVASAQDAETPPQTGDSVPVPAQQIQDAPAAVPPPAKAAKPKAAKTDDRTIDLFG